MNVVHKLEAVTIDLIRQMPPPKTWRILSEHRVQDKVRLTGRTGPK
jgi:hypothetical protein